MARVELQNISKKFDQTEVLKSIQLSIADGEFIALVGPSGCGKSTLLRIIAGLESQSTGDIRIDGQIVNSVRPSSRNLAMVFQSYALYPHLTVEENLMVPLKQRDLTSFERFPLLGHVLPSRREKMKKILSTIGETSELLQMEHLLKRKPGQLSGGQRQRVAVGRAMVRKPVAFLMDEPLSNLDAALRVHMRSEIASLHRQLQTTFIYVTHDQAEALTMADRIAVMMEGRILQLDTPEKVYNDPAELSVAEFVGSPKINTLPGEIDSEGHVVGPHGYTFERKIAAVPQKVTIGLRPEHLDIAHSAPNGRSIPVVVSHKENLGSDLFVHAKIQGSNDLLVVRTRPETSQSLAFGQTSQVWALREQAMIFNNDNQRVYFKEL